MIVSFSNYQLVVEKFKRMGMQGSNNKEYQEKNSLYKS